MEKTLKLLWMSLFAVLALTCVVAQENRGEVGVDELFNRRYQHKLISSGNNFPDFRLKKDRLDILLIGLHAGLPISSFQSKVAFSNRKMDSIINLLEAKGWLQKAKGSYKPTVFIATREDGMALYEYAIPISKDIVVEVGKNLSAIREQFHQTDISQSQSMEQWSFLLLSNVLLDNWQINNVEDQFLGTSARPERHGKNYYAAILESGQERESFGIYGNQVGEMSVYGNNRSNADLSSTLYYVSKHDNDLFGRMADSFLPSLMKILRKHETYSREVYTKTGYANEVSFEEFFIWWYHFIYTQATNLMAEANLLDIPESGNFVYQTE